MQTKSAGLLMVLAGLALILYKSNWIPLTAFITWHFLFIIIGIFLVYTAFTKSNAPLALIGGIVTAINLSAWGDKYIELWPRHWSLFVIMLGISFLLKFMIDKNNTILLIGLALLICGVFAFPGIEKTPGLAPVVKGMHAYWPFLFVGLGIIMMIRKREK